jgi:hypothetical protein
MSKDTDRVTLFVGSSVNRKASAPDCCLDASGYSHQVSNNNSANLLSFN